LTVEKPAVLAVPPNSMEAEQSLLGCLLQDCTALEHVAGLVEAGSFYATEHGRIYSAIVALVDRCMPADVVTVNDELASRGELTDTLDLGYLNALALAVPSSRNAPAYATTVQRMAMRRRLIAVAQEVVAAATVGGSTEEALPGVIERAVAAMQDVLIGRVDNGPRPLAALVSPWIDAFAQQVESGGAVDAIQLGLRDVDDALCGGARRGEVMVIGARPSMGKSALTLGIVRAVAEAGHAVLACTMEDSASMLISRHVASVSRTPFEHIRLPHQGGEGLLSTVLEACQRLVRLPVWLDDRGGLSLADVVQAARAVQRSAKPAKLGLVVIDYLQLMNDEGETRAYELANIARGLKAMAKRLDCVVLLLSQLNRKADETNTPPRLDHLAESGAIEQAADVIGLLWREARRNPRPDNLHAAQLELVKNKNGATRTVRLFFDGRTQRFADAAQEY